MNNKLINMEEILRKFDKLSASFIDASSIIYLKNIDLFDRLSKKLKLFSISEIIMETGYEDLSIEIYQHEIKEKLSNDEKLVECANLQKTPVITEDKRVINLAKKCQIDYYNTLMIINYLLYKDILTDAEYKERYNKLIDYAWYSDDVLQYGRFIYNEILLYKK